MENFCGRNLRDETISSPWEKVWIAVGRIDSGCGQLLGQALGKGLDSMRTWMAALVIYSPRTAVDRKMPKGSGSIFRALLDLSLLMDELHPRELARDPCVVFLKQALTALAGEGYF